MAQIVPHMTRWSTARLCRQTLRRFPKARMAECRQIADHLFLAVDRNTTNLVEQARAYDIHDVCVRLLTAPVGDGPNTIIPVGEEDACSLERTGGLFGIRALFLHGLGVHRLQYYQENTTLTEHPTWTRYNPDRKWDGWLSQWRKYWAVETQLDGYADTRYYIQETVERGWDNITLQEDYCGAIAQFKPHVIITHSMANNIIAAAIVNQVPGCHEVISKEAGVPGKVLWYSSQGQTMDRQASQTARGRQTTEK